MVECEFVFYNISVAAVYGFNRYMVECEYASFAFSNASFARFNRYMVECEYFYFTCRYRFTTVLIDTWWNVNFESTISFTDTSEF